MRSESNGSWGRAWLRVLRVLLVLRVLRVPSRGCGTCCVTRPFRFYDDAVKLCSEAKAPKLISEIQRLRQWLTKHQNENLSDAGKQKLMSACETYFKFAVARDATFESPECESVQNLISDILKLPEGKLVRSAGGKSKAMKWLELSQSRRPGPSNLAAAHPVPATRWIVADMTHSHCLQLVSASSDAELSGQVLDDVRVGDASTAQRVRSCLDAGGVVEVELDGSNAIVGVYCTDA